MKVYVIMRQGIDYNDEYYFIGGEEGSVLKDGYSKPEDAKLALRDKLKEELGDYRVAEWGEYYLDNPVVQQWIQETTGKQPTPNKWGGMEIQNWWDIDGTWLDFINWCELKKINWLPQVPNLYDIHEVEFFPGKK